MDVATATTTRADTRMMTVVHDALRRDLARSTTALTASPPPGERQRQAIARHLTWMMGFLHAHHESEDAGLYPLVRERRPDAAALLDRMDADHRAVATRVAGVESAASAYGSSTAEADRVRLVETVVALEEVLLPHLRREEDEAMPVVAEAVTDDEWRAIEQEHNLDGKSPAELGKEGHWLIDEATPEHRALVLGLVPPVQRFVLVHGFGRSYRRERDRCWRPARTARRVQKSGRTEVVVDAHPDAVWDVVRDPTRVGEWSHECVAATWLDGATRAEPGARFRGRNRQRMFRWGRICEVVSADDHELVWRTVPTALYPDSTEWRIAVEPAEGGTMITQRFSVVKATKLLEPVYATMIPDHRDRDAALREDLRRLGAVAAASSPTTPTPTS